MNIELSQRVMGGGVVITLSYSFWRVVTIRRARQEGSDGGRCLLSRDVLADLGIQNSGDDLLLGLEQAGDGVELLLEPGDGSEPGAPWRSGSDVGRVIIGDQRLDGIAW